MLKKVFGNHKINNLYKSFNLMYSLKRFKDKTPIFKKSSVYKLQLHCPIIIIFGLPGLTL